MSRRKDRCAAHVRCERRSSDLEAGKPGWRADENGWSGVWSLASSLVCSVSWFPGFQIQSRNRCGRSFACVSSCAGSRSPAMGMKKSPRAKTAPPKVAKVSSIAFPFVGRRAMLLNAARLATPENDTDWILLAMQDVSGSK